MANPAPKSLQRHGLVQLADNLLPGMEIARFERDFALIFREELAARFISGSRADEGASAAVNPAIADIAQLQST